MADLIIRYIGNPGDHFAGIPARDLSLAEYDALTPEQQAIVRGSAIYDYAAVVKTSKGAPKGDAKEPAGS